VKWLATAAALLVTVSVPFLVRGMHERLLIVWLAIACPLLVAMWVKVIRGCWARA
jgi:hypothetical protein